MQKLLLAILLVCIELMGYSMNLDSLDQVIQSAPDDTSKISLYHKISWELKSSNTTKALEYALEGYALSKKTSNQKGMESCINNVGVIRAMQGDFDQSIKDFEENLALNKEMNSIEGEATAHNNLGLVYYYKGEFSQAVEHYIASLNIYDELDNENGKASAYNNLGLIYENKTDYDKSLHYQKKALEIRLQQEDTQSLAYSYANIGNIYYLKEMRDTALVYFLKAEELFLKINDLRSIGFLIGNIGKIYENKEDYESALSYYTKGISLQEEIGDNYGKAINMLNVCEANSKLGNWQESIVFGLEGVKMAEEIGAKDILKQGYGALRHAYYKAKDFENAYKYSELFMEIKDSIFTEEKHEKIAELETKYDSEQKEKENELLRKDSALKDLRLDRSRIVNYGITGGLIICSLLGLFIFKGYSDKKKALTLLEVKNEEVVKQKDLIERKNNDILDSLNYAKRIQYAILPPKSFVDDILLDSFILYKPKDIVSGDFYWVERANDNILFAAVDCTGHGVPGAFMSIVGYNGLNQVLGLENPALMLDQLNELVSNTLHQTQNTHLKEGMDIALCQLNRKEMKLSFAGAYNSVYIVRGDVLIEKKGDRFSIGSKHYRENKKYTHHSIDVQKGDMVYVTTDGYLDQFGGEKNKKFMISNFRKLIKNIAKESPTNQKKTMDNTLAQWKGNHEQIDDICIIGVRV